MRKSCQRSSGFTIVEIIIIIVIVAIVAGISVAAYNGIVKQTQTSSLKTDMQEMDTAQKKYAIYQGSALPTNPDGSVSDLLVFSSNPGNTIVVKLNNGSSDFCIYGYNANSNFPTAEKSLVRASSGDNCPPLVANVGSNPVNQSSVYSTVAIIGQRLEAFKQSRGYYPKLTEILDIGLLIKPNADSANQQQLYCRNNLQAIYLQIDKDTDVIYVYETSTKGVGQPTGLPKLSTNNICPNFAINPTDPGYESTGIKTPDI